MACLPSRYVSCCGAPAVASPGEPRRARLEFGSRSARTACRVCPVLTRAGPADCPRRRSRRASLPSASYTARRVADDYAWMRDPDQPALREYLIAERAYYDAHSRHLDGLATELAAEAAGRIPAGTEYSVGWHLRGFSYRTRMPEHSDNLQLLRSRAGDSSEQVLLDENLVAAQTGYAEIGVREPSPDGALLAWSADTSGAEVYELRIRDLRNGEDLPGKERQ